MKLTIIFITAIAAFLSSCTPGTNLEKKPTRWVTIKDVKTNKPLPHVPLVYYGSANAYFIVGAFEKSISYISDEQGRACVPERVSLRPPDNSIYELDHVEASPEVEKRVEIYYLRRIKNSNNSLLPTATRPTNSNQKLPCRAAAE